VTSLLKFIGWLTIVSGIIAGIFAGNKANEIMNILSNTDEKSFSFQVAITWWISGAISGIIILAIGIILEHAQEILYNQSVILRRLPANEKDLSPVSSNSKSKLSSLSGYKMGSSD
jgi:H+/Cl- antiporter ClcA